MDTFQKIFVTSGLWTEFGKLFSVAWPVTVVSISCIGICFTSTAICGHLGTMQMNAVILADSMITIFGIAVSLGFSTACDTLFSNSIGGENKKLVGLYLQRAFLTVLPVLFILTAIHLNMFNILVLIGQEVMTAKMAAEYCMLFIPGLYFEHFYVILARYLQNQDRLYPPMLSGLCGFVFNLLAQYIGVYHFDMDYRFSAICQMLSYLLAFIIELVYILSTRIYRDTWDGFKPVTALLNFKQFYLLGLSGIMLVLFEDTAYEFCTIAAGVLGQVQLASQGVLLMIETLCYTVCLSIGIAVNVRVGYFLGAGEPMKAKRVYHAAFFIILFTASFMTCILLIFSKWIPLLFTNDAIIVQKVEESLWLLCLIQYFDGILAISAGVLKACGRQLLASILVFIGYWVIGLPMGVSLAFTTKLEVAGMWIGNICGIGAVSVGFFILVWRTDWHIETIKTQERVRQDNKLLTESASRRCSTEDKWSEKSSLLSSYRPAKLYSTSRASICLAESNGDKEKDSCELQEVKMPGQKIFCLLIKRGILFVGAFLTVLISLIIRDSFYPDYDDHVNLNITAMP